jgi:hypothetical protein
MKRGQPSSVDQDLSPVVTVLPVAQQATGAQNSKLSHNERQFSDSHGCELPKPEKLISQLERLRLPHHLDRDW